MKKKALRFAVMGILVVAALAVFVPVASASMVTKIMYAQGNVETFVYTAPSSGNLWVQISWVDHTGAATQFPVSEVDGAISGPYKTALYNDYDVKTLYAGTNPVTGTQTVASGKTYYISVYPYVDDCTAIVTMKLGGSGGTNISCTRMSDGATVSSPQTVAANAADGEFYPPSDGAWISTFQYFPGTASLYYADYNDYVYQRVTGSTYDTLSEAYAYAYYQGQLGGSVYGYQIPQRATLGGGGNPQSSEWYSVTPQIWPAAARPNVVDPAGNVMPGALTTTQAPALYTYAYEDSNVATQAPGYMMAPQTDANASKRSISVGTTKGTSVSFKFAGSSVDWYYQTNNVGAKVNVLIDGVAPAAPIVGPTQVDQSSASTVEKVHSSWTNIPAGTDGNHTITLTHSGLAGVNHIASPTTKMMNTDMFSAPLEWGGTTDPTPWAENNYDGMTAYRWGSLVSAGSYGGTLGTTTTTGDMVAVEFSGTAIDFIYSTTNVGGIVNVYIDGIAQTPVDQSSSDGLTHNQVTTSYTGLAATTHILLVRTTGTKGAYHIASPTNKLYTCDAFKVGATYIDN